MIAYRAFGKHGGQTAETPKKAAEKFFAAFPSARKCDIRQGEADGNFFTMKLSVCGGNPERWNDVTKKQVATLPDETTK